MSSTIVDLGVARIETTVTRETSVINRLVKTFLSNDNYDRKKIIGLDIERVQKGSTRNKTVLLQLCDGRYCLIVHIPRDCSITLPRSLFNFLNLPYFTFVGIGINKSLMMLESDFGLTCKNAVDVRFPPCVMAHNTAHLMSDIVQNELTSPILDDWGAWDLKENQIKLAVSNAYLAYGLGISQLAY
ncbi:hypothetical protein HA466_0169720 [Hirschfeldia incana]|nr:hypothetical protein HA466_0169720 [Hirschfeldia incana]